MCLFESGGEGRRNKNKGENYTTPNGEDHCNQGSHRWCQHGKGLLQTACTNKYCFEIIVFNGPADLSPKTAQKFLSFRLNFLRIHNHYNQNIISNMTEYHGKEK